MSPLIEKQSTEVVLKCCYCNKTFPYTIECSQAFPLKGIKNNFLLNALNEKAKEKPELTLIQLQCPYPECKKPLSFEIDKRKVCLD